ncbi:MAG: carbohydrate kinase family protein [Theionarchaea archaeon]|nr:MAG: hypothetical protein AYK18_16450 [Theionarchaea archaeon DG-70]MBU7010486.1 carbohydrate kinase family protein [Theionarchaea archaeon]
MKNISNEVVSVGSAAMDSVILLPDFPSPDQISVAHWCRQFCGGSSANVAVGLSRLGVYTGLMSKVGTDQEGVELLHRLGSEGVDIRAVKISGKTARTLILLTERGEKTIIADTECVLKSEEELSEKYILEAKYVYIGDCFLPVAEKAVRIAGNFTLTSVLRVRNMHLPFDLDLKKVISQADFVIMNEKTYSHINGTYDNFIVTRGKKGCRYVKDDISIEGITVNPIDTTGAGDAFCAGFISQILNRRPIEEALYFANAAGALSTTKYGAMDSMPSQTEVESLLNR